MKTKREATIEDLSHVSDHAKAELVNGEFALMSPTGKLPNYAAGEIFVSLHQFARQTHLGYAATDNLAFLVDLPNRKSFSPDVSFYTGATSTLDLKFARGAPLFAVEVRSENDYGPAAERDIAARRADYFAAGTQVAWDVDLLSNDIVRVYRPAQPGQPAINRRGDLAEAEPALPGWTMPVDDLFPQE